MTTLLLLFLITILVVQSTRNSTLGIRLAGANQQMARAFQCGVSELQAHFYDLSAKLSSNNTAVFAQIMNSGVNQKIKLSALAYVQKTKRTDPLVDVAMSYSGERSLPPPGYSLGRYKTHAFNLNVNCRIGQDGGYSDQDSGLIIVGPA